MSTASSHAIPHTGAHDEHHEELGFLRKYVFSTDHKIIGIQYGVTALIFLFFGFSLMMMMRWSIAYPNQPVPVVGHLLEKLMGSEMAPKGAITGNLYNSFGAMHGTIMIFLGIVPLAFAAFGNFVVPLQIGAPDMAFPRLNMASYQAYFVGGVIMLVSFFVPGGSAEAGWTSYSPLATSFTGPGQTLWIIAMVLLITSSLLGAVNFLATIIQLRAPGMTWMRLPFFVWAQFVTGFLLLLAFPPLEAAAIMQLADKVLHTSFFLPTGLAVGGMGHISGGGSPLLWQHLFWFLGHPEVYVLILLRAMGIVWRKSSPITRGNRSGANLKSLVYSALLVIGFLSFIVWAHHMYMTGMGMRISTFFQNDDDDHLDPVGHHPDDVCSFRFGAVPIRFNTPMLFALAFLPNVRHRRFDGSAAGLQFQRHPPLHDTYYVISALPLRGRAGNDLRFVRRGLLQYPENDGAASWVNSGARCTSCLSFIFMNAVFQPMFAQGMAGMLRRMMDGGVNYSAAQVPGAIGGLAPQIIHMNVIISIAAWCLGLSQIPFIINFFWSIKHGKKDPKRQSWDATSVRNGRRRLRRRTAISRRARWMHRGP